MDDREAYEFYADPANRTITGPARKRQGQRLTSMSSVRFAPEVIESVKGLASEEGITVGSWIRRLVQREIEQPRLMEIADEASGEMLRVPHDALAAVAAALMPAIIEHGGVDLRIGTPRPVGLIEGSGRRGERRALPSSLRLRSFACPHLSAGNVTSVICATCGPLPAAA
jgi:predicted DNA-binding protein